MSSEIRKSPSNDDCCSGDKGWVDQFIEENPGTENIKTPVVNEAFAFSSIQSLEYSYCGKGFYIGQFVKDGTDGIFKLIPGAWKKRGRSKNSIIKFYVIQGQVDIDCAGEVQKLETFCYFEIKQGVFYSMKNTGDVTAYVLFNRFESKSPVLPASRPHSVSSSSSDSFTPAAASTPLVTELQTASGQASVTSLSPVEDCTVSSSCKPEVEELQPAIIYENARKAK